jgi:hypothetical protein
MKNIVVLNEVKLVFLLNQSIIKHVSNILYYDQKYYFDLN